MFRDKIMRICDPQVCTITDKLLLAAVAQGGKSSNYGIEFCLKIAAI